MEFRDPRLGRGFCFSRELRIAADDPLDARRAAFLTVAGIYPNIDRRIGPIRIIHPLELFAECAE